MKRFRRSLWFVSIALLLVHLSGYAYLRIENYIIHRAGYAGSSSITGPAVANHWVQLSEKGYYRSDIRVISIIYLPAMWVERQCWYIVQPEGSRWRY